MSVRKVILIWALLIFSPQAIAAAALTETAIERRSWTPLDGAPSGAWEVTQTADGLLWFASPGGLYRYDGERFQQVEKIYGHSILSHNVSEVLALKRGIALSYQFGGISIYTPEAVTHYGTNDGLPAGALRSLTQTRNGDFYVGTSKGLARLTAGSWELLRNNGLPEGAVYQIFVDRENTFWASVGDSLYARPNGSERFSLYLSGLAQWKNLLIIRGKLYADLSRGSVAELEFGKKPTVVFDKFSTNIDGIIEGPADTTFAWIGKHGLVQLVKQDDGRYRIGASLEAGRPAKSSVLGFLVDREGNTWFTTLNGVERLRAQRVHDIHVPGAVFLPYIHKGLGDSILMAGVSAPEVLHVMDAANEKPLGLPDVVAMYREHADSLWAGSSSHLYHITPSGVRRWPLPQDIPARQTVQTIVVDAAGSVWVSITRAGLYKFSGGEWTHIDTSVMGNDAVPVFMHVDSTGRVWLGFTKSRVGELKDGTVQVRSTAAAVDIGTVLSFVEDDGHLIFGGENGLAWLAPSGAKAMLPEQIKAFRGIAGLAVDKRGELWAHGTDGIYRIAKSERAKFWTEPHRRLSWEILSLADGVRGNATQIRPLPSLTVANDGRIYYATNSQVAWIDPQRMRKNTVAPNAMILGVRAGNTQLELTSPMHIKAGTTSLEIKYAVTSLSIPEKVKIKYRLSGVDGEWQEPTGERVARYTNLKPGDYTFQIIAANEDGVWNNDGATLKFNILPEFWQTTWFQALVAALVIAVIIVFHRWRVITAMALSSERAAARMEERERIARTLHDNLLQGVHALILRSSTVLHRLPKGSQEERILENVLGQAEKLVEDTRDEVMALRDNQHPEEIVVELCQELEAMEPSVKCRLNLAVSSGVERLRSAVVRELCQVLKEAVINAARHSGANEIIAKLTVTDNRVEGLVSDDGVGIPPDIVLNGVPGHWGIVGMRERILKLGGTMTIEKNKDSGTVVRFILESPNAFN